MEKMNLRSLWKLLRIERARSNTNTLGQNFPTFIERDQETDMNSAVGTDSTFSAGTRQGTVTVCTTKHLVSELCQHFYALGWVSGTGGSVTIKVHDETIAKSQQLIVASPSCLYLSSMSTLVLVYSPHHGSDQRIISSGVQKERMVAEDMFVLSSNRLVLSTPPSKAYPHKPPKCSDSASVFLMVYELCDAGAVIHSHGIESCLVTMINPLMKEFRITHMEMTKGIKGHGYHDELVIPIIENTAQEGELVESLTEAIRSYPKASAVLVRNHGVYIWGDTWISAKTQAECYHYLFDAAVKLHQMGWALTGRVLLMVLYAIAVKAVASLGMFKHVF